MAKTVSEQLERNFYARCPPSRRPLHLGGVIKTDMSSLATRSDGSFDEKNTHQGSGRKEGHMQDGHDEIPSREPPVLLDTSQPTIMRTVSLIEHVARVGFSKTDSGSDGSSVIGLQSRLIRFKCFLLAILSVLRRLNPWFNYRKSRKLSKGNVVTEEDEQGVKRSYDSSLFRALVLTIWRRLLFAGCLEACNSVLITTSSLVTKRLIAFISTSHAWSHADDLGRIGLKNPQSVGTGIGLAIGLALMQEAGSLFHNHYLSQAYTCGEWITCIKP